MAERPGACLLLALACCAPAAAAEPGGPGDPAGLARALQQTADPEPLPRYRLEIAAGPMRALADFRRRLLERQAMSPDERVWVKGRLHHAGVPHDVRLRLRGDLPVHWTGEHWSYRVKFRRHLFEGRKEINLILPWDKHYGVEWLAGRIAADLGMTPFPARFVHLVVNDTDAGLYLESEHPTRQLLERSGLPPSSIFTFAAYWSQYFAQPTYHVAFTLPGSRGLLPLEGAAQIRQRATWDRTDPDLARKQLAVALELHRLLTEADPEEIAARAGQYLDLRSFARYVALQDLFGSRHALELNDNVRLYLNPSSGRFEFMPWDTSLRALGARLREGVALEDLLTPEDEGFRAVLERVPGVREERDRTLRRLVARSDAYRQQINALHARLIRLYPEDARLRDHAEGIDRRLARNAAVLERFLARAGAPRLAERAP